MKDGLDNIDELIKQAFDGFESNVDPSVWNNIQQAIGSGGAGSSTPNVDPSTVVSATGKSLAVKLIAGAAVVATIATTAYVLPDFLKNEDNIAQNEAAEEITIETVAEKIAPDELVSPIVVVENSEEEVNPEVPAVDEKEVVRATQANNGVKSKEEAGAVVAPVEVEKQTVVKSKATSTKITAPKLPSKNKAKASPKKVVEEQLSVSMNVSVIKGKAPLDVQFDALGNGVQHFWNFSDGSEEVNEDAPIHTFEAEGTYSVTLTAIDAKGNSQTTNKTIIVEKDYSSSLKRPLANVFSPNGDGQNDIYMIRGNNIDKVEATIMDNKGKVIYTLKSIADYWDGRDASGNYVIQGQYYIVGMAIGKDGEQHAIQQAINVRP